MPNNQKTAIETIMAVREICDDSCLLLTLATLLENNMLDKLPVHDAKMFIQMAQDMQTFMCMADEPRFSLYDYMDAAINNDTAWQDLAEQLRTAIEKDDDILQEAAIQTITDMAAQKRRTYEGDF